jgi:hypothetical protein
MPYRTREQYERWHIRDCARCGRRGGRRSAGSPGEQFTTARKFLDWLAGRGRELRGCTQADGIATVLDRAVADGRPPDDALWFGPGPLPDLEGLATRHGEATGPGVHPGPDSARYLWLDRAQQQAREHGSLVR